ncbi:hypothetical protein HED60_16555 [Planctomycetales bacterium ZRK34]|nr:hypothetical protein HED60_16555 [Planctomycetales bacterium ZRK34]
MTHLGRRIEKAVQNSADLDCTYSFFYNGQQLVETRDGSDLVLKQYVWGLQYIDELVQVGVNDDPADGAEDDVESFYYANAIGPSTNCSTPAVYVPRNC